MKQNEREAINVFLSDYGSMFSSPFSFVFLSKPPDTIGVLISLAVCFFFSFFCLCESHAWALLSGGEAVGDSDMCGDTWIHILMFPIYNFVILIVQAVKIFPSFGEFFLIQMNGVKIEGAVPLRQICDIELFK